jgi:hypothetical protein
MTHDPSKPAPKPTSNHIALVVRGHVQRGFGLQMKAEMLEGQIVIHIVCFFDALKPDKP